MTGLLKRTCAILAALWFACTPARALGPECDVPAYLLFGDAQLARVAAAVKNQKRLDILVFGSGSSLIVGPDGASGAYPARLEAALRERLQGVTVSVTVEAKPRQTAADTATSFEKLLAERKPTLVVWQTGTVEAMRGTDPEEFRSTLDEGVENITEKKADAVLVNMQYSPRTEPALSLGTYADIMRVVARDRSVPLFDRLGIMRYWNDTGAFDLYATTKDTAMARRVHDCIGQALATMILDAAHLGPLHYKSSQ